MKFKRPAPRAASFVLLFTLASLTPGCMRFLGDAIVTAPNRYNPLVGDFDLSNTLLPLAGIDHQFTIDIPHPKATLGVWVIEPKPLPHHRAATPKGTVLVLHGIYANRTEMKYIADTLTQNQYRVALVDLRGHGRSGGQYITFGVQESRDLIAVTNELDRRHLLAGSLGVYGISYGAFVALQYAAADPRVKAVVSVAALTSMREEGPHMAHMMFPIFSWLISEQNYQKAFTLGAQDAGFNPDDASALAGIAKTKAPVLIVHGASDWIVPVAQARKLYQAGKGHDRLLLIPGAGHMAMFFDFSHRIRNNTINWFDTYLAINPPTFANANPRPER